ncbi:stamen-specific protein FIL1 [Cucurbita pepo subsp. pepo]|uniref:Stamen-specific protein FIL1 n=1 Tax=Cucurbita maxima TaxID=3661 RepID=A0A6J1HUT5_CUCMA|nr:stamen-specific protein FIL1 [Cucurbita maxima]XP_023542033.1 stamen-specific protein FIL1 [Cucurbita pepo subsp. pepo]
MAGTKSHGVQQVILLLLVSVLLWQSQAQAQSCSTQLSNLNGCAPFVLPGASNPSPECCAALGAVQQDCLCSTLRISSTLPSLCRLPPLSCGTN